MKYKQQLSDAFAKMEDEFTSREFTAEIRSLNVPDKFINDGNVGDYLKSKCNHTSKYTWQKKAITPPEIAIPIPYEEALKQSISEAIKLLKDNGYKVMQQVTNFEEI